MSSNSSSTIQNDISQAANSAMTERLRRIEHELEMMILIQKVASSAANLSETANSQNSENETLENHLDQPDNAIEVPLSITSKIKSNINSPTTSVFSIADSKETLESLKEKYCSLSEGSPNNPYLDKRINSPIKRSTTKNIQKEFKKKLKIPKFEKSYSEPSYTRYQKYLPSSNDSSSFSSSPKSRAVVNIYSLPLQELKNQVENSDLRREKLENALANVQNVFQHKEQAIRQVLQSKQVAIEMARHLKSRYESLRASNHARGKALEHAQQVQAELVSRFEQTETAKIELEKHLIQLEQQLADSALANANLQQQIPMLTKQITQLTEEVASNAEAMNTLAEVESRLERYRDSAEKSALAVEAIQLRCQKLNDQLIHQNIYQQDKLAITKQLENLHQTTTNQEKQIEQLLAVKRSNEMHLIEKEEQVAKAENESNELRQKNYELETKLSNICDTITALEEIRKELAEQANRHETERHELSSLLKVYQQEANDARAVAQTEKDNLRIKDKIIADQGDSILKLKQQLQEKSLLIQKLNEQKNALEKQILEANARLKRADIKINQLEQQRQEMEEHFEKLNFDLENHYKQELCPPEAYIKYKGQLEILEEQVRERQKEYFIRVKELTEERNKEATMAQQARNQLVETIREFEAQMEIHRQAQSILKAALKSKEDELLIANATTARLKLELQESRIYAQHNRAAIEEKLRMACTACSQLIDHLILGPGMTVAELEDEGTSYINPS